MEKKTAKVKKGKSTMINFILDETGSMSSIKEATISGFNEYVQTLQKDKKSKATMTLTKFDSEGIKIPYINKPIKDVPLLDSDTYNPYACTNLYDAIGTTVKKIENEIKKKKNKPQVLIIIMTDGHENASVEYTRTMIFDLIKKKEKTDKWKFVFLGANQDSYVEGMAMGMRTTANFKTQKMKGAFTGLAMSTMSFVQCTTKGETSDAFENMDLDKGQ